MLKNKPIKTTPQLGDGRRISVMSRHTLPDGITPDPDISHKYYDEWWWELGPPVLPGSDYRQQGVYDIDFENGYKLHLRKAEIAAKLGKLIVLAKKEVVTVMCLETTPAKCHCRLLIQESLRLEPNLAVEIS